MKKNQKSLYNKIIFNIAKQVKQVINEDYTSFNPAKLEDNDRPKSLLKKNVVNDVLKQYFPRTKEELVRYCVELAENEDYDWNCIDTSQITDMSWLFGDIIDEADLPLGQFIKIDKWDISNVETFHCMFKDQDICVDLSKWDVSSCIWFDEMFCEFGGSIGDISKWNVSSGKVFNGMFMSYTNFNCDLSKWNVKNGIYFNSMFAGCRVFNSDLSKWNVLHGVDFGFMFKECHKFKCDLSGWKMKVNNQYNLYAMFYASGLDGIDNQQYLPKQIQIRRYALNYGLTKSYCDVIHDMDEYYYVEGGTLNRVDDFSYNIYNV